MRKRFIFAREDQPGAAWLARFAAGREEARRWYLGEGRGPAPNAAECRTALRRYMPELMPHYDRVCALVADDPLAHQMLSHYRPPPAAAGCSHAIWLGEDGPALVRNYDYPLDTVSDRFEATAWCGREIIAKAQRPWGGCLDGMNEDGLVASLAYGGDPTPGQETLAARFLEPPLYSRRSRFPTVYTAVYRPAEGRVDYLWPGKRVSQRIGAFEPGDYTHDYGELAA